MLGVRILATKGRRTVFLIQRRKLNPTLSNAKVERRGTATQQAVYSLRVRSNNC
jgi:hypothetical protein